MTRSISLFRITRTLVALGAFLGMPKTVLADNEYVNYMRSSAVTYVFVQQAVEAEYGRHKPSLSRRDEAEAVDVPAEMASDKGQWWQGIGFDTSIGIEVMKFFQLLAGHTFVNDRWRDDGASTLTGSRVHGGARLVFESPVANLELGGGILGSSMRYTATSEHGSFYGSGYYYSLGLNYFTSQRVSFYYEAKLSSEHMVKSSGSTAVNAIDAEMTGMSLGFRLWLF